LSEKEKRPLRRGVAERPQSKKTMGQFIIARHPGQRNSADRFQSLGVSDRDLPDLIKVLDWKPVQKNTLQGFFKVELVGLGLILCDVMVHQKNDKRWIAFSGRPYQMNNETHYSKLVDFTDWGKRDEFRDLVLDALDRHLEQLAAGGGR
jgi:hypothetical protein